MNDDSLNAKLDALGIDTRATPRKDTDGEDLPDSYAPLGSTQSINRFAEILLFGVDADDPDVAQSGNRMTASNLTPVSNNNYSWDTLHDEALASTPWFTDTEVRAAIDGDFDDDGLDEIAIVYQLPDEDMALVIMQDATEGYAISMPQIVDNNSWDEVFLSRGDYDGDSDVDLMVGMVSPAGNAKMVMLANDNGTLTLNGQRIDINLEQYDINHLALASGNLDYDSAIEFAVVANEGSLTSTSSNPSVNHRYFIYDDANTGFALLDSGKITADNGTGITQALVGNVTLGDIDGDSIDEVVLAGLDRVGTDSQSNNTPFHYVIEVRDDAARDLTTLTDAVIDSGVSSLNQGSGVSHAFSYVQAVTADLDGDGAREIIINQFVYQSLRSSPNALEALEDGDGSATIPLTKLIKPGNSDSFNFHWQTASFAAGDVTSDGRDNLVVYSQRGGTTLADTQALEVWGLDQIDGWKIMASYETQQVSYNDPVKPMVILPDLELDDGTAALKYSEGSHQLVFTEPLIIAALAAAPCATDLGQNLSGSCRTAFGSAVNNSTTITDGWNLTAGIHAGFEAESKAFGATAGASLMAEISGTMRQWETSVYSTTKTVIRETGALEDSVILSVLPLDIYRYTIEAHPDPNLVGSAVEVRLPRDLITTMVTADYYNERIADPANQIPAGVFGHTAGEPLSYPSAASKNSLLSNYTGLESDEFTTGVGQGQTIASITEFTSTSTGTEYSVQATVSLSGSVGVEADAGVFGASAKAIAGFSIGGGINSALEISRGNENIYQGSVGNISASAFDAGNAYTWGLFSYIYDDAQGMFPFEVLHYWVE
ncbi:MAG: hypothetical protein ACX931_12405 [Saccharospirillum sp.]